MRAIMTVTAVSMVAGCATLQTIAALSRVDFAIDRLSDARLAGVAIDRILAYQDLSAIDVARIGQPGVPGNIPITISLELADFFETNTLPFSAPFGLATLRLGTPVEATQRRATPLDASNRVHRCPTS